MSLIKVTLILKNFLVKTLKPKIMKKRYVLCFRESRHDNNTVETKVNNWVEKTGNIIISASLSFDFSNGGKSTVKTILVVYEKKE